MRNSPEETDRDGEAPPYAIVRACRRLGFESPEDVRWRRRAPATVPPPRRRRGLAPRLWDLLLGRGPARPRTAGCPCAERPPTMHRCTFTMSSGREAAYLIGQCPRCRTILWQPA